MSIGVTDHCIVRYFERHYNIDIEKIKNEILPDYIRRQLEENPDKENYVIGDIEFIIKNYSIVTCVPLKDAEPQKQLKNRPKRHVSNKDKKGNYHSRKKYTKRIKKRKGDYNG